MVVEIADQLRAVKQRVCDACNKVGRSPSDVKLIAVSKTFPAEDIRAAFNAGQIEFGESRFQEASPKIAELPTEIEWHFIGRLQRNKVRKILPDFPFVHAVDSMKLASHINSVAEETGIRPKVFLQVNQANETSKGGFSEDELIEEFSGILDLGQIETVGLMTIPPATEDAAASRVWFSGMRILRDTIRDRFDVELPYLSMGMSGDYEIAIEEGSTHVRVGSAIFGKRFKKTEGELG